MDSPGLAKNGFYQAAMQVSGILELSAVEIEFFRRMTLSGFRVSNLGVVTITGLVTTIPNPITQDLLFTDATYDLGKSGSTRPRDIFLSRNATVGGSTTLTGALIGNDATDSTSKTTGAVQTDGGLGVA